MADMTASPRHAPTRTPGLWAAWAILAGAGTTSVVYNVYHAVHNGSMAPFLALLYGFAPVFLAALVSHIVAEHDGGWVMQGAAILVMLGAMALSIGATAAVVQPAAGSWMQWLFGGVLDGATLVALRVILASRSRKAEAAAAAEAASAELEAGRASVQQATANTAALERELATVRAELGAELEAVRAELETARAAVQASGPRKRSTAPRRTARTAPVDDMAMEASALKVLATDMNMSGAELGRRLGVTPGYGRKLKRRLTAPDRPVDRSALTGQDRSSAQPRTADPGAPAA